MRKVILICCFSLVAAAAAAREEFFVGCNYWASHAGVYMWRNWNPQQVERDLDAFRDHGMTVLRVFPLWSDFQPLTAEYGGGGSFRGLTQAGGPLQNAAGVDAEMMRRFRFLCDAAEKRGIKLVVGLVTGWMSGRLFVPPGLGGKNVITDPQALMWETRFVRHFVRETKDHPAICAWDLGNECNCMGGASQAEAWNWMNAIASAIRLEDAKRPVVSGMHSCSTRATDAWSLRMQGELMDVTTTHPYPLWTPDCHREDFNTLRDSLHAAAESALYRDLSGKPCFPEEAGSMGPTITCEERAAAAMRVMLFTSWAEGLPGFLWWCGFDQTHLNFAPYDWTAIERELGLFKTDGTPKPTVRTMKAFAGFLTKLPFDRLPAKRYDAVVLVSSREGAWRQAFGAYLLAAQAGFAVRFTDAEQPLPDVSFYILPSGNGYESYTRGAWRRIVDRVRAGATLLMTMGNGTAFSDLREVAGIEIDTHYRQATETSFAFAEWPTRTIRVSDSHVKRFRTCEAKVLVAADGNPVLTENVLGKGKVLFFNYAIEERSVANGGCWTGDDLNPLYLVYRTAAARAGVKTVVAKPAEASDLVLSEHPSGDVTFVVAVNAGQTDLTVDLKVDGLVRTVCGAGVWNSGRLSLAANDGCVLVIERER